jgi:predicted transcriptional regulator
MKTLIVGIASYEDMKARTLAIAKGETRRRRGEPDIWFPSAESFARILSEPNRKLLRMIAESEPDSLTELAELSGRQKSNLSRTLKTMERFGLVRLESRPGGRLAPRVSYDRISVIVPVTGEPPASRDAA